MGKKTFGTDIKPQYLRASVTESATDTFTETSFPTPNLTEAGYVMEILKIFYEYESAVSLANADAVDFALYESSKSTMPNISDAGTIMKVAFSIDIATNGALMLQEVGVVDFTDGAGNGLLVGRKELILAVEGSSQANPIKIGLAILYRLVKVSAAELIGLISS